MYLVFTRLACQFPSAIDWLFGRFYLALFPASEQTGCAALQPQISNLYALSLYCHAPLLSHIPPPCRPVSIVFTFPIPAPSLYCPVRLVPNLSVALSLNCPVPSFLHLSVAPYLYYPAPLVSNLSVAPSLYCPVP